MSDKVKNLIVRAITGALFVAIMVAGFLRPHYMVVLFAVITGMSLWEYTGLVNEIKGVRINRFISTVAGVYFFCLYQSFISRMRTQSTTGHTPCWDRCISLSPSL